MRCNDREAIGPKGHAQKGIDSSSWSRVQRRAVRRLHSIGFLLLIFLCCPEALRKVEGAPPTQSVPKYSEEPSIVFTYSGSVNGESVSTAATMEDIQTRTQWLPDNEAPLSPLQAAKKAIAAANELPHSATNLSPTEISLERVLDTNYWFYAVTLSEGNDFAVSKGVFKNRFVVVVSLSGKTILPEFHKKKQTE